MVGTHFMHSRAINTIDRRNKDGTKRLGFSPTRQTPRALSAMRGEVFGVSHELWVASY